MEFIQHTRKERLLIRILLAVMMAANILEINSLVMFYVTCAVLVCERFYPVWKSDIKPGETKENAKMRHAYPELHEWIKEI